MQDAVKVDWLTRRVGNQGYVLERRSDGSEHEFGPMPAALVPIFVQVRRAYLDHKLAVEGYVPVMEADYTYLKPTPKPK